MMNGAAMPACRSFGGAGVLQRAQHGLETFHERVWPSCVRAGRRCQARAGRRTSAVLPIAAAEARWPLPSKNWYDSCLQVMCRDTSLWLRSRRAESSVQ